MSSPRFNPFPGLRPFRMEEKYLFFGREAQTAELLQRLRMTRFLAVVGTSGSGKSSLVQAGLVPELYGGTMLRAGSHWQVVVMRPGGDPLTHLARALVAGDLYDADREDVALEVRATLSRSGLGLVEAARQSDLDQETNLLVVIDQFEEIFRFRRSGATHMEEAQSFVNLLLSASSQSEFPIYVALTMRSDYLGDCSEFPGLAEAVNRGEYLIPRLSREQKRAAIASPVKVGGGEMAPRLLQKLLNDVGDNPDHLPVLQHALMRTWDYWEGDHEASEPIDLRHYRAVGGMAEALSRHADEVYAELPDDRHRAVAERVFKALTERSLDHRGVRRPATLRRLCAIAATDEETLRRVVDPFRRWGRTFLTPSEGQELQAFTVIDISHESLMRVWRRLDGWVEEESQSARIYQRLADTAALYSAGRAALYHDPDLQIATAWLAEQEPNKAWALQYGGRFHEAMRFLEESRRAATVAAEQADAARRRELEQAKALAEAQRKRVEEQAVAQRKLKRLLIVAATVALLAVLATFFAILQGGRANRSEQAARGLAEELESQLLRGDLNTANSSIATGDFASGLAYLARAMRTNSAYTVAGLRALWTMNSGGLPVNRFQPLRHDKPIDLFLQHPDEDLLLTSSEAGADVRVWDMRKGGLLFRLPKEDGIKHVQPRWTRDGRRLVTLESPGNAVKSWDSMTGEPMGKPIAASLSTGEIVVGGVRGLSNVLAFLNSGRDLELWDLDSGRAIESPLPTEAPVIDFRFSPDGGLLVTVLSNQSIAVWGASDGKLVRLIDTGGVPLNEFITSLDGRWLAALGDGGRKVNWWNLDGTGLRGGVDDAPAGPPWIGIHDADRFLPRLQFLGSDPLISVVVTEVPQPGEAEGTFHATAQTFDLASRDLKAAIDFGPVAQPFRAGDAADTVDDPWQWEQGSERTVDPFLRQTSTFVPRFPAVMENSQLVEYAEDLLEGSLRHFGIVGILRENAITLWDLRDGTVIARLITPEPVRHFQLLPDGRTLIAESMPLSMSNDEDRRLYVFDVMTGALTTPRPITVKGGAQIVPSPDQRTLAVVGAGDNRLQLWDYITGRPLGNPISTTSGPRVLFSHTGDRMAVYNYEVTYQLDGKTSTLVGQTLGEFSVHEARLLPAMPDVLVAGGQSASVRNAESGWRWFTFHRPQGGDLARLQTWNAETNEAVSTTEFAVAAGGLAGWSSTAAFVATPNPGYSSLSLRKAESGEEVAAVSMPNLHTWIVGRDGRRMALADSAGKVAIWKAESGLEFMPSLADDDWLTSCAFDERETLLAVSANKTRRFGVIDTETASFLFPPLTLPNLLVEAVFLPQGKLALSASSTRILLLDLQTGKEVGGIDIEAWGRDLDLSPDKKTLAIGSGSSLSSTSGKVYLWDVMAGTMLTPPLETPGVTRQVEFSHDGATLAVATMRHVERTGAVQLWDVTSGAPLSPVFEGKLGVGDVFDWNAPAVSFLADDSAMAISWGDGVIQTIPLPPRGAVPAWLPELAETVGTQRLRPETGILEPVSEQALAEMQRHLAGDSVSGGAEWIRWARWMFQDPVARPLSPGARITVADYAAKLRASERLEDVREAVRLTPTDPLALAWLGLRQAEQLSPVGSGHWKEVAERASDRALELQPDDRDVWALRSELMRKLGRREEADLAAARAAREVDEGEARPSNGLYSQALSKLDAGDPEGAEADFTRALQALGEEVSDVQWRQVPQWLGLLRRLKLAPSAYPIRRLVLPEPIPGTFEDFEEVPEGGLPIGWEAQNRTLVGSAAGLEDLNDLGSDSYMDWVVVAKDRLIAVTGGYRSPGWLRCRPKQSVNGRPVTHLLSNHVLHAESEGRGRGEIQYVSTPDFDCRQRSGIHVGFASAYSQDKDKLGLLEYSVDAGKSWLPVFYRLHSQDVERDDSGQIDAVGTFTRRHHETDQRLAYFIVDGELHGRRYGDFIGAALTPSLAPYIEVSEGAWENDDRWMRVELYRLAAADGQATVRMRFGQQGRSSWRWSIDDFGLYAIGDAISEHQQPEGVARTEGPDSLLDLAAELLEEGDAAEARLLTLHARRLLPGESRALALEARALAALGDFSAAEARLSEAIALHPEMPIYWRTLAAVYEKAGDVFLGQDLREKALLYFEAADVLLASLGPDGSDANARSRLNDKMAPSDRGLHSDVLVPFGSVWRYLDNGVEPDSTWVTGDFDDREWKTGGAKFGFGDNGILTEIDGGPSRSRHLTTWFRMAVAIPDVGTMQALRLGLVRDDGAIVYLNGEEVVRSNMRGGETTGRTLARETVENENEAKVHSYDVPVTLLKPGRNVIAVEVHQASPTSSDLAFDLELSGVHVDLKRLADPGSLVQLEKESAFPADLRFLLWLHRAQKLAKAAQVESATDFLERARSLASSVPEHPAVLAVEAQVAAATGEKDDAADRYRRALQQALGWRGRSPSDRRLFLPRSLKDFSRLGDTSPFEMARAFESETAAHPWMTAALAVMLEEALGEAPAENLSRWEGLKRRAALRVVEEGHRITGREAMAEAVRRERDMLQQIPVRDPARSPKQLDLSSYLKTALWDGLANLPETFKPRRGVDFDLRGLIELESGPLIMHEGKTANEVFGSGRPDHVYGIRVDQTSPAVHFLVGAALTNGFRDRDVLIGRFDIHFEDGTSTSFPLRFHSDVGDWHFDGNPQPDDEKIGWWGFDPRPTDPGVRVLAEPIWRNPHPEKKIATIDFVSAKASATPMLLAITLE